MRRVQGSGSGMGGQFHQAGNKENISKYHQQLRKHHHHSIPSVEIIYCILQNILPFKKKSLLDQVSFLFSFLWNTSQIQSS